jgi:hypothetical protein
VVAWLAKYMFEKLDLSSIATLILAGLILYAISLKFILKDLQIRKWFVKG